MFSGDFTTFFSKMILSEFWGIEIWRLGKEHIPEERIGQGVAWALKFSWKLGNFMACLGTQKCLMRHGVMVLSLATREGE